MGIYHTASDEETKGGDQGTRIFVEEDVQEIGLLAIGALAPCLNSSLKNCNTLRGICPQRWKA
jgi:hypothetical protein